VPRVLAYHASRDLVPLYSIYALLFADHGVSATQISLLFVVWSATSFVFEVPSGAWADSFDRRRVLVVSAAIYAAGFAAWMVWQTFTGFALGFVLWGLSSALMSGTFESLVYDELVEREARPAYPTLIGWAQSTALLANLAATAAAAWLFHLGGYALVGWSSVAICGLQALLAATLPVSLRARRPAHDSPLAETERAASRYLTMLRAGLAESRHRPDVRRVLLLAAAMVGLTTYDEYFPLVARSHGLSTSAVPLLIAVVVAGQAIGTAAAGRSARLGPRGIAAILAAGAVLVSVGALVTPYAGFAAITIGYGLANNAMLVGETRLQDTITGPARATVTSVLGLLEEVVALTTYVGFALGSQLLGFPTLVALLGLPTLLVAAAVAHWLPAPGVRSPGAVTTGRPSLMQEQPERSDADGRGERHQQRPVQAGDEPGGEQ
jgi:MFS family permease